MHRGFIKLWRRFAEWEWYDSPNTKILFIHFLLKANYRETRYHGHIVPRGSLVFGRRKVAKDLHLTERKIRTALNDLQTTNEIAIKTTNKFSIITLLNWDTYQDSSIDNDQQNVIQTTHKTTSTRPSNDQHSTTSKEYKEYKKEKNTICSTNVSLEPVVVYDEEQTKKQRASKPKQPPNPEVKQVLDYFGEVFMNHNGVKCCFAWAKDSVLIRDMLAVYGKAALLGLIDKFFASNDEFILKSGYSVGAFKGVINKLAVGEKSAKSGLELWAEKMKVKEAAGEL